MLGTSPRQRLAAALLAAAAALSACEGRGGSAEPSRGPSSSASRGGGLARAAAAAAAPIEVAVAPVLRGGISRVIDATGTLFGTEEATISAKVPGRVVATFADVGDVVPPGAPLAQIEPIEYELALEQRRTALLVALAALGLEELPAEDFDPERVPTVQRARLEAANAEARFRRATQLWNEVPPLISEQDYADLRTVWEVAGSNAAVALLEVRSRLAEARSRAADLAIAAQRLDETFVRAPSLPIAAGGVAASDGAASRQEASAASAANGSAAPSPEPASDPAAEPLHYAVASRFVSLGEYVREATPLFRLVAEDPIKFRAEVPERFAASIRRGQSLALRVESWPAEFPGTITRVNPQVNVASRTFQIEAELANRQGHLRPGAFARATIILGPDDDAILVPAAAMTTFAGVTRIYSVVDGVAKEHVVTPGRRVDLRDERAAGAVRGAGGDRPTPDGRGAMGGPGDRASIGDRGDAVAYIEAIGAPPDLDAVIVTNLARLAPDAAVRVASASAPAAR